MTGILLTAAVCTVLFALLFAMVNVVIAAWNAGFWEIVIGVGLAGMTELLAVAAIVVKIITQGAL